MNTISDQLGKQAKQMTEDIQEMGQTVSDAAQQKLGQASDQAAECYKHGRDKVHGAACACEQYLGARPLRSVLIAAGIGWLLGRLWKRRG